MTSRAVVALAVLLPLQVRGPAHHVQIAATRLVDGRRRALRTVWTALSEQLRDQFVTATYLWLDTENRKALYSAGTSAAPALAGRQVGAHPKQPPTIRSETGVRLLSRFAMQIQPGDRFLLYTAGVTEPENAHGDSFGDVRLEQVVRDNQSRLPSELSINCSPSYATGPTSIAQQDDITLIVIDVV